MTSSVIIPTYNYGHYINRAIQSVLSQEGLETRPEIIIIDDGSTDDTKSMLESLISTGQVQYYFQENQGKAAAMERGIALAKGAVIFNLDADDYYLPGKMAATIAVLENHPSVVHVGSAARVLFEDDRQPYNEQVPKEQIGRELDGRQLLHFFYSNKMLYGGGSTFAGRSRVVKKVPWDSSVDMYADEWLLLQTLLRGNSFFLQEPMSVWWVHGKNYSAGIGKGITALTHSRLSQSSLAVLHLLARGDYPGWLLKLYRFKHEHRIIMWLEAMRKKDLAAVWRFIRKGILSGNKLSVLKKYHAFRRLFPSGLIEMFKQD